MKPEVILFIEASCSRYSIAVKDFIKPFYEAVSFNSKEVRGENILPIVGELLEKHNLDISSIKLLATTKGPGSLTGLRIAMSYIKTISQVLKIPISAISTLFALQECSMIDLVDYPVFIQARKNTYYFRLKSFEKDFFKIADRQEAQTIISENQKVLLEEGCDLKCDTDKEKYVLGYMNPEIIMDIAVEDFNKGKFFDYTNLLPEYGGKSVAEILFKKRRHTDL